MQGTVKAAGETKVIYSIALRLRVKEGEIATPNAYAYGPLRSVYGAPEEGCSLLSNVI